MEPLSLANGRVRVVVDRLKLARGAWGAFLLCAPRHATKYVLKRYESPRFLIVVRVLGARQVAQALLTMPARLHGLRPLGRAADILHVLSMVGVSIIVPRYRRAALTSAVASSTFAALELVARHP